MGELITHETLNAPAYAPASPLPIAPNNEFDFNMGDIKEIANSINEIIKNFKEIGAMRQQFNPASKPVDLGIDTEKAPPEMPTQQTREVQPMKPKKINEAKLRIFLNDLLTQQALKLPADIQEKKIRELTGENWTAFSYKYKGMLKLSSDDLLDVMTKELSKAINELMESE